MNAQAGAKAGLQFAPLDYRALGHSLCAAVWPALGPDRARLRAAVAAIEPPPPQAAWPESVGGTVVKAGPFDSPALEKATPRSQSYMQSEPELELEPQVKSELEPKGASDGHMISEVDAELEPFVEPKPNVEDREAEQAEAELQPQPAPGSCLVSYCTVQ